MPTFPNILEVGITATGLAVFREQMQQSAQSVNALATAQERAAVSAATLAKAEAEAGARAASSALEQAKIGGGGARGSDVYLANAKAKSEAKIASNGLADAEANLASKEAMVASEAAGASGALTGMLSPQNLLLAAATAMVTVAKISISAYTEWAGQVRVVQGVMGGTAEQASLAAGRFSALNVDTAVLGKGMINLGNQIATGKDKLNDWGIVAAKNKDGTLDLYGTVDNLRNAWQRASDAGERDAIVKQLQIRNASTLIPYLEATNDQLAQIDASTRRSGLVINQEQLDKAHQFEIAMGELKNSIKGLEVSVGSTLAKNLSEDVRIATVLVDKFNEMSKIKALPGSVLGFLGGGKLSLGDLFSQGVFGAIGKLAPKQAQGTTGGFGAGVQEVFGTTNLDEAYAAALKARPGSIATDMEMTTKADEKAETAAWSLRDANLGLASASLGVADAQQKEADAQDALNVLVAKGVNGDEQVKNAKQAVVRALESQADAQEALNKSMTKATALELEEASLKITDAANSAADATLRQREEQEKLNGMIDSGASSADEIANQQLKVKEAGDAVTKAQVDGAQAQEDLIKLRQKGTALDPAVIGAERTLRDAKQEVARATQSEQAAEANYYDAIKKAQHDLAAAHQDVTSKLADYETAQHNARKASDDLNVSLSAQGVNLAIINAELAAYPDVLGLALAAQGSAPLLSFYDSGYSTATGRAPGRTSGGSVEAGMTYLVGEHGPELLKLGASGGTVVPNPALGGGGTHVEATFQNVFNQPLTPAQIAREQAWMLMTVIPQPAGVGS